MLSGRCPAGRAGAPETAGSGNGDVKVADLIVLDLETVSAAGPAPSTLRSTCSRRSTSGAARESTTHPSRPTDRRPTRRLVEASALRRLDAELDGHHPASPYRRRAPRLGPVSRAALLSEPRARRPAESRPARVGAGRWPADGPAETAPRPEHPPGLRRGAPLDGRSLDDSPAEQECANVRRNGSIGLAT